MAKLNKAQSNKQLSSGLVGYARVSTADQSLDLQTKALKSAGCSRIFTDTASGKTAERPGLDEVKAYLREGDTMVVWKLDRLGRSVPDLINILDDLKQRGVKFLSLQEKIDTDSAAGRMFFQMIAIFAEFERNLISERTQAGLAAARAEGRKGGRKPVLTPEQIEMGRTLRDQTLPNGKPKYSAKFIARELRCSVRTLGRCL